MRYSDSNPEFVTSDWLFAPPRAELRRQITTWSGARIDVVPAGLGDDSVLYGALALASVMESELPG